MVNKQNPKDGKGSSWLHPEGLLDPSTTVMCEPSLGENGGEGVNKGQ
jgi:hypothetical protein